MSEIRITDPKNKAVLNQSKIFNILCQPSSFIIHDRDMETSFPERCFYFI